MSDGKQSQPSGLARGWRVEPDAPVAAEHEREIVSSDPADGLSNVSLMLLGVFGGLTLLYTWGWFDIARAYSLVNDLTASGSGLIGGILQNVTFWVAPLAPAAWFVVAFVINRHRGAFTLGVALLLGAVLTLPYPMLLGGTPS